MDLKVGGKGKDIISDKRSGLNQSGTQNLNKNHPMYGRVGFCNNFSTCYLNTAIQVTLMYSHN